MRERRLRFEGGGWTRERGERQQAEQSERGGRGRELSEGRVGIGRWESEGLCGSLETWLVVGASEHLAMETWQPYKTV